MAPAAAKRNVAVKERPAIAKDSDRAISEYFLSKNEEQAAIKYVDKIVCFQSIYFTQTYFT